MAKVFTDSSAAALIASGQAAVIDFWAEWCGPCRALGPIVDELAAEYEGRVAIGKLNVDDNTEIPAQYGIRSIPTLLFFKDGALAERHVGMAGKSTLVEKINALL